MTEPTFTLTDSDGNKRILSVREAAALKILLESEEMKKVRDRLVKNLVETTAVDEKEALAIVGPMLLEGLIVKAQEMAKQ